MERQMVEQQKMTPNPKRQNRGTAERRNGRKSLEITKKWNDGKFPEILKNGMTKNPQKSYKTE